MGLLTVGHAARVPGHRPDERWYPFTCAFSQPQSITALVALSPGHGSRVVYDEGGGLCGVEGPIHRRARGPRAWAWTRRKVVSLHLRFFPTAKHQIGRASCRERREPRALRGRRRRVWRGWAY